MAIMISACLAGKKCRYDGGCCRDGALAALVERGEAITVCPEVMGGMATPRKPSEIEHGFSGEDVLDGRARVLDCDGNDVTEYFLRGAYAALEAANNANADRAILKAHSPSCGSGAIYDGTFSGMLREGYGVTAALLRRSGITVEER